MNLEPIILHNILIAFPQACGRNGEKKIHARNTGRLAKLKRRKEKYMRICKHKTKEMVLFFYLWQNDL